MNIKNKNLIFLITITILIMVVIGHNFYRYFVAKDYIVHAFIECNPINHSCFKADNETSSPVFKTNPYAKVEILSINAPPCLEEHTCRNFSCESKDGSCHIIYCSENSVEEGENCVELKQ